VNLLLDTNIFLEIILEQERAADAKNLLSKINEHNFFISHYSLHSIGTLLFYKKKFDTFQVFIQEILIDAGVELLSLSIEELSSLHKVSLKYNLDFDDSYQYATAENHNLTIVSFDGDFDSTEKKRKEPNKI
jgi:hypothetical protein